MSGRFLGQLKISVHRMSWLLRTGNGATWSVVGEVLAMMIEESKSDVKRFFPGSIRNRIGSINKWEAE